MLSHPFNRSTAIFRNALGYRPIARFFATRSPFPCKVCQTRLSQFWGSVQRCDEPAGLFGEMGVKPKRISGGPGLQDPRVTREFGLRRNGASHHELAE